MTASTPISIFRNLGLVLITWGLLQATERAPLVANLQNSAAERWQQKKVLSSRLLDDMEKLDSWTAFTNAAPLVVDARFASQVVEQAEVVAKIALTSERFHDGGHSLRLRNPARLAKPGPVNGRGWGESGILRTFQGEDWRPYNRISLWIFADCPGHYAPTLDMHLRNDGAEKLPAPFAQEGETSLVLKNHEWNHVLWEIGNVARDKITGLEIVYGMAGNERDGSDTVCFDFDQLELQQVEADYTEGWGVWPGRISYSQMGYLTSAPKSALASDLAAREFRILDQTTNQIVLTKPVQTRKTRLGTFQVMDFTELRRPGTYVLEAGQRRTHAFRIGEDIWRDSILKALNFLYTERCGTAIPGVHGPCHQDWQSVHGDKRIIINGGWHDAGDLSQGMGNTGEIDYALFTLAERLKAQGNDPELYERVLEEAKWGLDWILKTRFGDGYRTSGSISSRHTNGIIGDSDDVVSTATRSPMTNALAAAAEAVAARMMKDQDPRLAAYALRVAQSDWQYAIEDIERDGTHVSKDLFSGSFDSAGVQHEAIAEVVLASVDLYRASRDTKYADKAAELASILTNSQERHIPDWTIPLTGYFYTGPAKDRILHYCHRGREQAPIFALTALCDVLPDHPDWMKWYSAVALHSEYLKSIVPFTEPYGVIPASIYRDNDYLQVPEGRRESFRRQVLNGIPLGSGHYLRLFPVWLDYRGHFGTILPQAQALAEAAHLRGDLDAAQIAGHQFEWIIGRNPFAQSMMYGEGYDFVPQYTPSSGDMVGSLPVGIQTRGDADVPYWPVQSTWTYKEVWVHPVGRWLWLMAQVGGSALVEGQAAAPIVFTDLADGQSHNVLPDAQSGRYHALLTAGNYRVESGGETVTRSLLPSGSYVLDLRQGHALDIRIAQENVAPDGVFIRAKLRGNGRHHLVLRTDNLSLDQAAFDVELQPGIETAITWHGSPVDRNSPWVAVVVPDNDPSQRKELIGTAPRSK